MVLSSFYEQPRPHLKPHHHPHPFGSATIPENRPTTVPINDGGGGGVLAIGSGGAAQNGWSAHAANIHGYGAHTAPTHGSKVGNEYAATHGHGDHAARFGGVVLPPPRRVVKVSVEPFVAALTVGVCTAFNTILCVVVPQNVAPLLGTQWGSFMYMWSLISVMQLITHSIYLCTPLVLFGSLLHMFVVTMSAILIPSTLFSMWLWLAPGICVVLLAQQINYFLLVYTNLHNQWLYVTAVAALVLLPMAQLVQIDTVNDETLSTAVACSAVSIYTLYGFAIANSRGSVLLDVTVGASPLGQMQE